MVSNSLQEVKAPLSLAEAGDRMGRFIQKLKPLLMPYELSEADAVQRAWHEAKEREVSS